MDINQLQDEKLKNYRNVVALIRSPGIVVDYVDVNVKNTVAYVGSLYAGTSFEVNKENLNAENFLRLAENAAHNSWFTEQESNKLDLFFNESHDWTGQKLRNLLFTNSWKSKLINLFSESKDSAGNRNKWMENFFVIKKTPWSRSLSWGCVLFALKTFGKSGASECEIRGRFYKRRSER